MLRTFLTRGVGAAALCLVASGCHARVHETPAGRLVRAVSAPQASRACARVGVVRTTFPEGYPETPGNIRAVLRNRAADAGGTHIGRAARRPDGYYAEVFRCSAPTLRRERTERRAAVRRALEVGPDERVEAETTARIEGGLGVIVPGGLGVLTGVGLMLGSIRCNTTSVLLFPGWPSCQTDDGFLMAGVATMVGGFLLLGPGLALTLTGVHDRAAHRRAVSERLTTRLRLAPTRGGATLALEGTF